MRYAARNVRPVIVPDLGESIEHVRILRWLKAVGDAVTEGEPVVEISTDKIDAVLEAPCTGVLTEHVAAVDDHVAIGATIATVRPT